MHHILVWLIAFLSIAGVITRPFNIQEAIWAAGGAIVLVVSGLLSFHDGFLGVAKGADVYLFLTGMMLLAETAREEKLFDWLAAHATKASGGSSGKLFLLIYLVGVVVTVFLSNDATAVVLTPAVAAAAKAARVEKPLPYLFICAFIANAASFVLPISNPANLVIYGSHMPPLSQWISQYIFPSVVSIIVTYFILRFTQRNELRQTISNTIDIPELSKGGKMAISGILFTAVVLLIASAFDVELGLPTAITGVFTSAIVIIRSRKNPLTVVKGVSWAVLPLVAGLFVIVEALNSTGIIQLLSDVLQKNADKAVTGTMWASGIIVAFGCNLLNNLPAGLITGNVVQAGHLPEAVKSAVLIGIDLGPNLSLTGSLATILWLVALRREGLSVSAWAFLKIGFVVMTTALVFSLGTIWLQSVL